MTNKSRNILAVEAAVATVIGLFLADNDNISANLLHGAIGVLTAAWVMHAIWLTRSSASAPDANRETID